MAEGLSDNSMAFDAESLPARSGTPQAAQHRIIRLACQPCRQRKIACDRQLPCSNCSKAGLTCNYEPRKRSTIKAQRVHITSNYEKKIDTIQEQTQQIAELLGRLTANNESPAPNPLLQHPLSQSQSLADSDVSVSANASGAPSPCSMGSAAISLQAQFEGESSLSVHTAFANSLIERAVNGIVPLQARSAEMATTMEALRRLVEEQNLESNTYETTYRRAKPDPNPSLSLDQTMMPPIHSVMAVLQTMKTNAQFDSVGFFMVMRAEDFLGFIRKVYFPGGGFSPADFIIANGGLIDVFLRGIFLEEDDLKRKTLQRHMETCEINLETALSRIPIHIPNTIEYCLALLFGVYHCIKSSKSSAAWALVTTALNMCISAGYHRSASTKNDAPMLQKQKSWVFWSLYSVEKGMSLRLGRSSSVSDYDITLPLPEPEGDKVTPYYTCTIRWIKLSCIQGRIYKMLYSPAAMSGPQSSRTARAQSLAAETKALFDGGVVDQTHTNSQWKTASGHQVQLVFFSEEILYLSTLSLILKALPPDDGPSAHFAAECIDTARTALERHQAFIETIGLDRGRHIDIYINWTILYSPFLPFIIVVCCVIEAGDSDDLSRLEAFVESLETAKHYSTATAKMYIQCKMLYDAALQYVEMAASKGSQHQDNSFAEFDAFIQTFGMPPLDDLGNPGNECLFDAMDLEHGMNI